MALSDYANNYLKVALCDGEAFTEVQGILNNPFYDRLNSLFTGTGNVVMSAGQKVILVKKASGAATQVTLPTPNALPGGSPAPASLQIVIVKDAKGDAHTNNITIVPDGVVATTIDGASNVIISAPYGSGFFAWNGTEWNVLDLNFWNNKFIYETSLDGLTAHAGGGQGSAFAITTMVARFTTVGTGGDSSVLPASKPGLAITVVNAAAANSMNVFPASGDQINALGANTAFALAANKTAIFTCTAAGQWHSILTA